MDDWAEQAERAKSRFADGAARLPSEPDERQRQLTRMGNAAWAAGLSLLMAGYADEARDWLLRSAETYRRSWDDAPPESWGRPLGALKSRLIAGDLTGARADAQWPLAAGAAESESRIGRYCAALACLVLGDDEQAAGLATTFKGADAIPHAVAATLVALAAHDGGAYESAVRALLVDFEARGDFLEDTRVADTVLALQALAAERGLAVELDSPLLPRG